MTTLLGNGQGGRTDIGWQSLVGAVVLGRRWTPLWRVVVLAGCVVLVGTVLMCGAMVATMVLAPTGLLAAWCACARWMTKPALAA